MTMLQAKSDLLLNPLVTVTELLLLAQQLL